MTIDCDTRIGVAKWEDDEYVITLNGSPTGHTCTRADALRIREWLVSACLEDARRPDRSNYFACARCQCFTQKRYKAKNGNMICSECFLADGICPLP